MKGRNHMVDPLNRFQRINTHRAEEAEAEISRTLSDIQILSVRDQKRFHRSEERRVGKECRL